MHIWFTACLEIIVPGFLLNLNNIDPLSYSTYPTDPFYFPTCSNDPFSFSIYPTDPFSYSVYPTDQFSYSTCPTDPFSYSTCPTGPIFSLIAQLTHFLTLPIPLSHFLTLPIPLTHFLTLPTPLTHFLTLPVPIDPISFCTRPLIPSTGPFFQCVQNSSGPPQLMGVPWLALPDTKGQDCSDLRATGWAIALCVWWQHFVTGTNKIIIVRELVMSWNSFWRFDSWPKKSWHCMTGFLNVGKLGIVWLLTWWTLACGIKWIVLRVPCKKKKIRWNYTHLGPTAPPPFTDSMKGAQFAGKDNNLRGEKKGKRGKEIRIEKLEKQGNNKSRNYNW